MTTAEVREKYRGLSPQELIDKAYELGFNFESKSFSCSQSKVAALHELLDIDDTLVKASTSLSGGTAEQFMGSCGALTGGLMVIGHFFGRPLENISYQEQIQANVDALFVSFPITQALVDKFVAEYGSFLCPVIQRRLFGRTWWLRDVDEQIKFDKAGGHTDPDKCCHVAGNGAKWVMETLLDQGVVEF